MEFRDHLRQTALEKGASLFGVCDLDRIRSETNLLDSCYQRYTRGISMGVSLDPAALADIRKGPTRSYCDEYLKVNEVLDNIARTVASDIMASGFQAERIPASEVTDWEKLRGHVSHKLIGRYAGHGWIGKNILLINPSLGARVRYVTVLTDSPLPADAPRKGSCGACTRCARVCPAGAIAEDAADFNLDACFRQLGRFNELLGQPHYICGLCVAACDGKTKGATHGTDPDTAAG